MVTLSALFIATIASSVARAVPLHKRIDQTISDSTQKWVAACTAAGGAGQCSTVSVNAFQTLLAAGDPCDHQDQADNMIDLAHQLNNDSEMIRLTQIFVQQPRNAPDSLSVLYCQKAPRNSELNGLFQCQFQGCNPTVFTKNVNVGGPGTIPFGMTAALSPAGSCPANPTGPIADGVQLDTLTEDPGTGSSSNSSSAPAASTTSSDAPAATSSDAPSSTSSDAPAPTATATSSSDSGNATVTVVEGDDCNSIAAANGVDVADLMNDNPAINSGCTNLEPGQVLVLPSNSTDPSTDSSDPTDSSTDSSDSSTATATPAASSTAAAAPSSTGTPVSPPACAAKASSSSKRSISMSIAKRIAQADLPAVAQSWQDLCFASGGDTITNDPCVQLAGINGINGLLAGSDPCLQQDNADAMIDFANSPNITNKDALIANAVAYRKHPRNALDIGGGLIPSSPFCQKAPKNQELVGVFNGQLNGVNPGLFGGPKFPVVAFGDPASCPFGQTPDVSTCTCS